MAIPVKSLDQIKDLVKHKPLELTKMSQIETARNIFEKEELIDRQIFEGMLFDGEVPENGVCISLHDSEEVNESIKQRYEEAGWKVEVKEKEIVISFN